MPCGWGTNVKVLLVHQNFPGQFRGLAPALQQAGHDVRALSVRKESVISGVHHVPYQPERSSSPQIHPWLLNTETAVIRGEAAAERVQRQAAQGWTPDVVLGHTGWGEMLFMRQVLPHARLLGFNEIYYRDQGGDVGFDPEFPTPPLSAQRLQVRSIHWASSLLACDVGITPTQWQADGFPPALRKRLRVIHDGQNGLLVDFFKSTQLAKRVCDVLADPGAFQYLRQSARQTVMDRYDFQSVSWPAYENF